MRVIDIIWQLPYGKRTLLNMLFRRFSFEHNIVISLQHVLMEIDVTQNLDLQYAYGIYDVDELAFLEANYKKGDFFLDIGANMGFYSLVLAKRHPEMKILAFEPDSYNINKFNKNIVLNNVNNITLCDYALSDNSLPRELMLNTANNRGGNSFVVNQSEVCGEHSSIRVPCKTLFTALTENHCHRVGIAKLDVEGFEYPILKAFYSEAPKALYPRAIVVEAFGDNIKRVGGSPVELLIQNNYELVHHNSCNFFFKLR